jgi:hypothetical protein
MLLFTLILLVIVVVSGSVILWTEITTMNDRIEFLSGRLMQLEKDAVKVTFTGEPKKVPPCVGHELESQKEEEKLLKSRKSNPKQFDGVVGEEPFVKTRKRNHKTSDGLGDKSI